MSPRASHLIGPTQLEAIVTQNGRITRVYKRAVADTALRKKHIATTRSTIPYSSKVVRVLRHGAVVLAAVGSHQARKISVLTFVHGRRLLDEIARDVSLAVHEVTVEP